TCRRSRAAAISSCASSASSGSSRMASAAARSSRARASAASAVATGSSWENSRDRSRKRAGSPITPGSASRRSSSSRRSARVSSVRRRLGVIGQSGWGTVGGRRMRIRGAGGEQAVGGGHQPGVAGQRGFAQGGGRRVQQPVGEGVGEELQHFVRIAPGGQLLAGAGEDLLAGGVAERAQAAQAVLVLGGGHRPHGSRPLPVAA